MHVRFIAMAVAATVSTAAGAEGFRAEIHGGYDRLSHKSFFSPSDNTFRPVEGAVYGLGLGYHVPIGKRVFAGIEGNVDFSTGTHCQVNPLVAFVAPGIFESCLKPGRDLSANARVGTTLVNGRTRLYALAGYSNLRLESYTQINRAAPTARFANTRDGIRLGAGIEHGFDDRFYGKVELRYSDYGRSITRNQALVGVGVRF